VTVGQRKGLGVAGSGERRFAVAVDVPRRRVVVGSERDLECDATSLVDLAWVGDVRTAELLVQTSAHGDAAAGLVEARPDGAVVRWLAPHRRVAPGQSVVLYEGDEVVGSAIAG
jgi:tRNA-specific 2-thiouridylase